MKKLFFTLFIIGILANVLAFDENEKLYFDVKYGGVAAAEASLEVKPVMHADSIACLSFITRATTKSFFDNFFKVRDEIVSIWDKEKKVSYRLTKKMKEGGYRQYRVHAYYPNQNKSLYLKWDFKKSRFKKQTMDILENTQDVLSAFYLTRQQKFAVGDTIKHNVCVDGRNYPLKVLVKRKETIKTIYGKKECFVVEPILKGVGVFKQSGQIEIWLSADEHKVPFLLKSKVIIGYFRAELTDAKNVPYKKK